MSICFKADLPEMKKDDVKVTIENGILYISGERRAEKEERRKNSIGSNASSAPLSADSPCPRMRTQPRSWLSFRDGVLQVHLPKRLMPKQKQSK